MVNYQRSYYQSIILWNFFIGKQYLKRFNKVMYLIFFRFFVTNGVDEKRKVASAEQNLNIEVLKNMPKLEMEK